MPGYRVSLRPVSIHADNDINAIHEWLSNGYSHKGGLPADELQVFFILLAESTYAQAFMVLLNDETSIGQLEVYQVVQDELNNSIDASEGDFRIYIPVMPVLEPFPEITTLILKACLQYFFSCAEVQRVFWVVPANDKERNKLALKTGFHEYQLAPDVTLGGDRSANVYQCSRSNFSRM